MACRPVCGFRSVSSPSRLLSPRCSPNPRFSCERRLFPGVTMQFKQFGRTGLMVSRLILGTGTFGKQTDEAEGHRMLDRAAEAGVNIIDTADIYPPGAEPGGAEIIVGRWLRTKRSGFILATKGGGRMGP